MSASRTAPLPGKIDVHSHFLPPAYTQALKDNGHTHPDGMPAIPAWSLQDHLTMMSTHQISKSILSISSPGTSLQPSNHELNKSLTRDCNSFAARLKAEYPENFGFWASLPMLEPRDTLEEIDVAIEAGADGFALLTNYFGIYLGDERFESVMQKLNDVRAKVFIHPTTPCIRQCGHEHAASQPDITKATPFGTQYPVPIFEFLFDTARTVINLFQTGTVDRYPNITFIIPHVGGCLPPLWDRFIAFSPLSAVGTQIDPVEARSRLARQFYFDLAGIPFNGEEGDLGQLKALVRGFDVRAERLLYGSDFPFTTTGLVGKLAERMSIGLEALFDEKEREMVYEGNAKALLSKKLGSKAMQ